MEAVNDYYDKELLDENPSNLQNQIEAFATEIDLRKVRWLLVCSYSPHFSNLLAHVNVKDKTIKFYSKASDKILIAGDFNAQVSDIKVDTFCNIWNINSFGKEPTQTILLACIYKRRTESLKRHLKGS